MNERIKDNPSYKKMRDEIEGFKALLPFAKAMKELGLTEAELDADALLSQVSDIEQQLDKIALTPDLFNDFFAERGWIAQDTKSSLLSV